MRLKTALFFACCAAIGVACAAPAPPPAQQAPSGQVQPRRGGVLHLPVSGTETNLNPYLAGGSTIPGTMFETLVAREVKPGNNWNEDQKLAPWLADRWERLDPNTYVFSLRKDVTWHDGRAFGAEDVVHSIEYLKGARGLAFSARAGNIASSQAVDQQTVRIVTSKPNPDFIRNDILQVRITQKQMASEGQNLETTAIATGPFKIKQFDRGTGWTVVRNDRYWMPDLPYLDGIAGHNIDRSAMLAAMASGKLDVMNVPDKPQLDTARALVPDSRFEKFYGANGYGLFFALDAPPYNDYRVRQAVNLGLDRQDMVVKGAFGDGIVNAPGVAGWVKSLAIPQEELLKLPGYNPTTKSQDAAQAKRLLAEAGYSGGLRTRLTFNGDATNARPIAEVTASQLKDLGIEVTLAPLDRASLAKVEQDESFEMHILTFGGGRGGLHERLHSQGALNKRGPYDPELDALLDKLMAEFDETETQNLTRRVQRRLYDRAYFLGAIERAIYTVYQPWVNDMLNNYGGFPIPFWAPPITWFDTDLMPEHRRGEKP